MPGASGMIGGVGLGGGQLMLDGQQLLGSDGQSMQVQPAANSLYPGNSFHRPLSQQQSQQTELLRNRAKLPTVSYIKLYWK